jgi:exodeoxyribonuclease V alpha subunit
MSYKFKGQSMDTLIGVVDQIVFSNDETGFTVAHLLDADKGKKNCIVGLMPDIQPGETLVCEGGWKYHNDHGKQFEVKSFQVQPPQNLFGIQKYLESGIIKGIGPKYAERIVQHFGLDTLAVIDHTPARLNEIEGLGKKRIAKIKNCWDDQKSIRTVMIFLRSHGVSASLAQKIFRTYGQESLKKLQDNPYAIAKEIHGIGFKTADKIALSLGIQKEDPRRLVFGIEFTLWELSEEGHTCCMENLLIHKASEILEVPHELIIPCLNDAEISGSIIRQTVESFEYPIIWLRILYFCESGIARELSRIKHDRCNIRNIEVDKALSWVESKLSIGLAEKQKEAVMAAFSEKVLIITGGPGTGKSTITKAILTIAEKLTSKILLAAPTGKAAKRMAEITHKKASTIHSLLEYDFIQKGFKKGKDNQLECDLIMVDEASMIDTMLLYHLLKAIPSSARVIIIGDVDQLPSVGPGNILKDLINSEKFKTAELKEIFRQAKGSKIITNAHKINSGEFPDIISYPYSDFFFIEAEDPETILDTIVKHVKEVIPKKKKYDPIEDIQVLSPMKKGIIGIENLNATLQNALNPAQLSVNIMGRVFRIQDKVMQIQNNYQKLVYNGDVGIITEIDKEQQMLIIEYDRRAVEYEFSEIDEITLAYACSIHKYQGSECPCVIIPVHTTHFKLLHRNLLYTGITRGKRLVILVGSKKAIAIAVRNNDVQNRYTLLKTLIKSSV